MLLWLLLAGHMIADFYLQTTAFANKKTEKFSVLFAHSLVYAIVITGFTLSVVSPCKRVWGSIAIICVSHFIIDSIKVSVDKKWPDPGFRLITFLADQTLHIGIIAVVCRLGAPFQIREAVDIFAAKLFSGSPDKYLRYMLIVLTVLNPSSVLVKKVTACVLNKSGASDQENEPSVGRMIGYLERLIIVILILCKETGAIGFVLTAKSLARYKQLNEQGFAEKYLVGTLTSTIAAMDVTIMLRPKI